MSLVFSEHQRKELNWKRIKQNFTVFYCFTKFTLIEVHERNNAEQLIIHWKALIPEAEIDYSWIYLLFIEQKGKNYFKYEDGFYFFPLQVLPSMSNFMA